MPNTIGIHMVLQENERALWGSNRGNPTPYYFCTILSTKRGQVIRGMDWESIFTVAYRYFLECEIYVY